MARGARRCPSRPIAPIARGRRWIDGGLVCSGGNWPQGCMRETRRETRRRRVVRAREEVRLQHQEARRARLAAALGWTLQVCAVRGGAQGSGAYRGLGQLGWALGPFFFARVCGKGFEGAVQGNRGSRRTWTRPSVQVGHATRNMADQQASLTGLNISNEGLKEKRADKVKLVVRYYGRKRR